MTNKPLNDTIHRVTQRVIANSRDSRSAYLELMDREGDRQVNRGSLSCSNLAHAFAGAEEDQEAIMAAKGRTSAWSPHITTCCPRISPITAIPNG